MNIRHLRTLVAAVERGSFAAAGEAVGVSHSAVSLQIKSLEDELGVSLFDRSKRPPAPTARGRALADHARKTLEHFDAARAIATGELVKGKLTVGAVPTMLSSILPHALATLRDHHPELRIEIRSDSSAGLAARLQRGELDIALCTRPDPSPPGLEWRHVATEPFVVIAPAHAPGETDADLLTGLPFIWFNRKTWAGRGIEAEMQRRGIPVSADIEIDSLDAISSLVGAGLGVSIVPVCKGARPFPRRLRSLPFGDPPYCREIGALVAPEGAPEDLIETFMAALRAV
ncbi:LysR family transcriptional regulator [Pikeienuella piscinae]|uniref:LysR family transcriptional regulator n=1 Tax=Pikeienuella piscinae TaxID=2748098 RepID=A0A7M3T5N6_9RHOB|nr:LysR substrate-binding domain-containing protein [Pikeienuella piscinae]QIE57317.1 LysR family transcriptional regulator [Pikeienuella piscinae]